MPIHGLFPFYTLKLYCQRQGTVNLNLCEKIVKLGKIGDIHDTKSQGEKGDFPQDLKLDAPIPCI